MNTTEYPNWDINSSNDLFGQNANSLDITILNEKVKSDIEFVLESLNYDIRYFPHFEAMKKLIEKLNQNIEIDSHHNTIEWNLKIYLSDGSLILFRQLTEAELVCIYPDLFSKEEAREMIKPKWQRNYEKLLANNPNYIKKNKEIPPYLQ